MTITIDVFADVVCPWCYIGEKRLARALVERPDLEVELRWRPFQLRPDLPPEGISWEEFARVKFGGPQRAQAVFEHVTAVGEEAGAHFDFGQVAGSPNTADAHRLALLAADHGLTWPVVNALFEAYFAGGRDLSDPATLVEIVAGAGLAAAEAEAVLSGDRYAAEVAASQAQAEEMGIQGVPATIFDNRFLVGGAQSPEVFLRALELAAHKESA